MLLFLLTIATLGMADRVAARGNVRDYVLAGVTTGLACSTKYTACLLVVPLLIAHAYRTGIRHVLGLPAIKNLALYGVSVIALFLAGTPYAVLDWPAFRDEGLIFTWRTGAPAGTLLGTRRSYGLYASLLANAQGWPLFLCGLIAVGCAVACLIWRRG